MQASPAYLMRLEYAAQSLGWNPATDLPALRALIVTGGGWTVPWANERIRIWGAQLYEVYANSQRAFCYTCELGMIHGDRPGVLHSLPHLHLLEVVDPDTGRHVESGQEGEIVVTAFDAAAAPIVRYATGDRAIFRAAETCGCGRAFDGIEAGSVARYDDMLRVKEVNLWPLDVDEVLFANPWLAEYRGEVDLDGRGREVARVLVEFDGQVDAETRDQRLRGLAAALKDRIRLTFDVQEWPGESLRSEADASLDAASLKIRRWTDRRKEAMTTAPVSR
jgi:phenylacetate-CoA ligase